MIYKIVATCSGLSILLALFTMWFYETIMGPNTASEDFLLTLVLLTFCPNVFGWAVGLILSLYE